MKRIRAKYRPARKKRRKILRAKTAPQRPRRALRVIQGKMPGQRAVLVRTIKHSVQEGQVGRAKVGSGKVRTKVLRRPNILPHVIVAVTGSAGKTTTKEMIASILRKRWPIYKSEGNQNYIGNTRRSARRIRSEHQAAVLEFGILRRGNLQKHCSILQPSIGVITNIGTAHVGNFGSSINGVALAKSELIRYMKPSGLVFLNADCPYSIKFQSQPYRGRFAGTFISVGVQNPAGYQGYNIRYEGNGMRFECKLNRISYSFFIPVQGEHNISNALLAIAVTHTLGFAPDVIQEGLRTFYRPHRRFMTHEYNGIKIIDDTYSANPAAMKAALNVLDETSKGTNVAVLGSMLELGRYTVEGHEDVGRHLAQKKVDFLYTLGNHARSIADGAIRAGFPKYRVQHCVRRGELHRLLTKLMKPNTTFLVKGSNKMKMNGTANFLRTVAAKQPKGVSHEQPTTVETAAKTSVTGIQQQDKQV
ncbi:UDP-N-acetylmuramoyl-tripeptide--D-alanyl-D-alanine ligase [Brevibacillus sp. H7]|uniref:UDP-N-acetylmuramoyl-tripeptide--D-alanyl-D- alanine ligase n=1 Tax=Brevibacillus sp. H7 TaxID=3349138 RepID=UPI00381AFE80